MKIKYIVFTAISKRDAYGNRYSRSSITSTATGRHVSTAATWGDDDQVMSQLRRLGIEWQEIYRAVRDNIGKREFNRAEPPDAISYRALTKEMIDALDE